MVRNQLVLLVTDKCNARCEICGYYCSPERTNVMDEKLMLEVIDQARDIAGVDSIVFSGGEPTLFPELLAKGAEQAKKHGLQVILVSNGHWGGWSGTKAAEMLATIMPHRIHFSSDAFHRPFIDDVTFGRALALTYAAGIEAHVCVNQMRVGTTAQEHWNSMGPHRYLFAHKVFNETRYGRATQFRPGDFHEPRLAEKSRCAHDASYSVAWNGIVFPCCRFEGQYGCLAYGKATDAPLAELLQSPVAKLLRLLETQGFPPLIAAARQVDPGLAVDDFSHGCTACNALFNDTAFVREFSSRVEPVGLRKIVEDFLVVAEKNGPLGVGHWLETDVKRRVELRQGTRTISLA